MRLLRSSARLLWTKRWRGVLGEVILTKFGVALGKLNQQARDKLGIAGKFSPCTLGKALVNRNANAAREINASKLASSLAFNAAGAEDRTSGKD